MQSLDRFIASFASFTWGLPLILLLIGGGIYLLIQSRLLPFRYLTLAIDLLRGKHQEESAKGDITHFQALSTALSSTIGMGNIAGVAVAISIGGPGAIFWMWISGIVGMSTKFFTGSLAIMYRGYDSEGNIQGGPMYFIQEGLSKKWHWLATFFALSGLIGALPVFNVNQLTQAVRDIILIPNGWYMGVSSDAIVGVLLVLLTAIVIFGGISRISKTAERLVLELKGKFANIIDDKSIQNTSSETNDIQNALISLGYSTKEAISAVKNLPSDIPINDGIKDALKFLSRKN